MWGADREELTGDAGLRSGKRLQRQKHPDGGPLTWPAVYVGLSTGSFGTTANILESHPEGDGLVVEAYPAVRYRQDEAIDAPAHGDTYDVGLRVAERVADGLSDDLEDVLHEFGGEVIDLPGDTDADAGLVRHGKTSSSGTLTASA